MTSSNGYRSLSGTRRERSSSSAAWRLTARPTCHGLSVNLRIPGTKPTVDTVIDRAPMPITAIIRRSDSNTLSKLASDSPIPMNTTLVTRPGTPGMPPVRRKAAA